MIALIRNPNASGCEGGRVGRSELERIIAGSGYVIETATPDELGAAITRCQLDGVEILVSCGGDGTHNSIINALISYYHGKPSEMPLFAPLAAGAGNIIPRAMAMARKPERALEAIVAGKNPRKSRTYPLLRLWTDYGLRYGFVFAAGSIATFLRLYYDRTVVAFGERKPNLRKALGMVARVATSFVLGGSLIRQLLEPLELELDIDCARYQVQPNVVLAAPTRFSVLGFKPFSGMEDDREKLNAMWGTISLETALRNFFIPRVYLGLPLKSSRLEIKKLARFELAAKKAFDYVLDGELYCASRIKIERGFELRVPVLG